MQFVCAFFCKPAKMAAKKMSFVFGMEVEERKMSEKRLSCLNAEQESPEPVEYEVIECFTFKKGGSMATAKQPTGHARSAITGRYVPISYAQKHPKTTVIEKK